MFNRFAFRQVQYFLYTDKTPCVSPSSCLPVVELANRLVLPRLITLIENVVIQEMKEIIEQGGEVFKDALDIFQPSQVL